MHPATRSAEPGPPNKAHEGESSTAVGMACSRAMGFLLKAQSADGAWRDFLLRPGRSDAWVTSYVGSRLTALADPGSSQSLTLALQRAVHFLENARHKSGGWGYNTICEPDADSTARVIVFLRKTGCEVLLRDYAALARFQLADGAFATYKTSDPTHGWGRGHPDVTVVALQALAGVLPADHVALRLGFARITEYLTRRDPWASYWWPSRQYFARELLVLQRDQPAALQCLPEAPSISDTANSFDWALALEIALLLGVARFQLSNMVDRLLSMQAADGGWPSSPILRITDPRSRTLDDRFCHLSPVVCDDRRLFTTATVLAALKSFDVVHAA